MTTPLTDHGDGSQWQWDGQRWLRWNGAAWSVYDGSSYVQERQVPTARPSPPDDSQSLKQEATARAGPSEASADTSHTSQEPTPSPPAFGDWEETEALLSVGAERWKTTALLAEFDVAQQQLREATVGGEILVGDEGWVFLPAKGQGDPLMHGRWRTEADRPTFDKGVTYNTTHWQGLTFLRLSPTRPTQASIGVLLGSGWRDTVLQLADRGLAYAWRPETHDPTLREVPARYAKTRLTPPRHGLPGALRFNSCFWVFESTDLATTFDGRWQNGSPQIAASTQIPGLEGGTVIPAPSASQGMLSAPPENIDAFVHVEEAADRDLLCVTGVVQGWRDGLVAGICGAPVESAPAEWFVAKDYELWETPWGQKLRNEGSGGVFRPAKGRCFYGLGGYVFVPDDAVGWYSPGVQRGIWKLVRPKAERMSFVEASAQASGWSHAVPGRAAAIDPSGKLLGVRLHESDKEHAGVLMQADKARELLNQADKARKLHKAGAQPRRRRWARGQG